MPQLFDPLTIGNVTLRNRIMMSPMCQYMADADGLAADWHTVHYGGRAVGGVGLIMIEATAVEPRGRISEHDLGLWHDAHIAPIRRIVQFCKEHGAQVGVQLAHAGRKAWSEARGHGPEAPVAPSSLPFAEGWRTPEALDEDEIDGIAGAFGQAAERAGVAGIDVIEIHGAHGYLVSSFLSPLANHRSDGYGGDHQGRARFAVRVADAIRTVWPAENPLFIRLSCSDWTADGNTPKDAAAYARILAEHGVDVIDCSSGGVTSVRPPISPGYQVPFAECVRHEGQVPTAAVGLITRPQQAEEILASGKADLVALGRALLRNPYWPHHAVRTLGTESGWPTPYRTVASAPVYPEL